MNLMRDRSNPLVGIGWDEIDVSRYGSTTWDRMGWGRAYVMTDKRNPLVRIGWDGIECIL